MTLKGRLARFLLRLSLRLMDDDDFSYFLRVVWRGHEQEVPQGTNDA